MTNDIIAIHGLKGAGKDTVAKMILHYRPRMRTFAFGDKLKVMCAAAFDCPLSLFHSESMKEIQWLGGPTPRQMMMRTADVMKKEFGADFFAKALPVAAESPQYKDGMVITDLRAYDGEERDAVDWSCGRVIHVLRSSSPYSDFSHNSERALPISPEDFVIRNDGAFRDLREQVRQVLIDIYGEDALDAYPFVGDNEPPP